mmetsp:Transcript_122072/g.350719  ORF Transcript_122072/g.350719 Transcript_122072/m.350719 type:complete len:159 (+) Transcript_122072:128-604(+)
MGCTANKGLTPEDSGGCATASAQPPRLIRPATNSERARELPLIPESAATILEDGGSICSMTTVATPVSLPASHLDSVAYSTVSANADRESLAGARSLGPISLCATTAYHEEDSKSTAGFSAAESRFDSQNYLQDLDRLLAEDHHAARDAVIRLGPTRL